MWPRRDARCLVQYRPRTQNRPRTWWAGSLQQTERRRTFRVPGTDLVDYIVEDKDASDAEKEVTEINTGTFCFDNRYLFDSLREIRDDNSQSEYYLTDIMEILRRRGLKAAVYLTDNSDEALGVNSVEQKAELERKFAKKFG